MFSYYYTFGPDHRINGVAMEGRYVKVTVPNHMDPREVFMLWLGSNEFAFEYSETEFRAYMLKYDPVMYASLELSEHVLTSYT